MQANTGWMCGCFMATEGHTKGHNIGRESQQMKIRKETIRLTKPAKWEEEEVYENNEAQQSFCTFPSIVIFNLHSGRSNTLLLFI